MSVALLIGAHAVAVAGVEAVFSLSPLVLARMGVQNPAGQAGWAGLAAAAGVAGSMLAAPLWARIADSGYRRAMLARAYAGMALAAVAALVASEPWQFVGARALLGVLGGGTLAASSLVAAGPSGAASLARVQAAALWGAALGPALGGLMLGQGHASAIGVWAAATGCLAAFTAMRMSADEAPAAAESGPREDTFNWTAGFASAGRSVEDHWLPILAGGDAALAGAALTVSRLSASFAVPAWGSAALRHGARRALVAALMLAGAFTMAQALPLAPEAFLAVRVLIGAAAGGLSALFMAEAVERHGESRRAAACAGVSVGADAGKAAAGLAAAALPGASAAVALGGAVLLLAPRFLANRQLRRSECAVSSSTHISSSAA